MQVCGKDVLIEGKLIRIGRIDGEGYQFLEDPEAALEDIRKCRARVDLFTFTQKLSETTPKYNYPMEWDNMAVLRVSTFEDWMANQINFKVRNKVRKAEKSGVTVREVSFDDDFVRGVSAIYNESPVRQGKPFWHYGKDLETVHKMNATFMDQSIFIGAFFEGSLIGFAKLVSDPDRGQAGLMQILSMIRHRDKAPTNALVAQAVRSCADRGIPYLWYAKFSYGRKERDTLAEFKEHNGFRRVDFPRYCVPLTVAGQLAFRLNLHHSMIERIPGPVVAAFRKIRGFWFSNRSPIAS